MRYHLVELVYNPALGSVYLVFDWEHAIGYLVVCFDFSLEYQGRCAWIDELFAEQEYRGNGIGTQLLDLAEEISREHRAGTLHLEVGRGNRAVELYPRRGFVDHNRYLMTKRL